MKVENEAEIKKTKPNQHKKAPQKPKKQPPPPKTLKTKPHNLFQRFKK